VKHLKVDILPLIANDKNARDIAAELVEVRGMYGRESCEENVVEKVGN
jgi:hypothetical protein